MSQQPTPWSAPAPAGSGVPEPAERPLEYHQILRAGRRGWAWPLLGLPFLVFIFFVFQTVIVLAVSLYYVAQGVGMSEISDRLAGDPVVLPSFLLVVNLGWAAAIFGVWLVVFVVHGLKPRWVASVVGGIRWKWFATCLGLALIALFATLVVSALVPAQAEGGDLSGELNDFTTRTRDFLIVIVLFTPLQAAGEEYAFRGYLTQACGVVTRSRAVAVLVPALLFALAHGFGQDLPIFFDRFAFGIVAGLLVVLTGGLEAGIAMHVLNNWFAFGLALGFGDMTSALNPTGGSWWSIPVTLTQSLVFLGVVLWAARRSGISTRTDPRVLEPPRARV